MSAKKLVSPAAITAMGSRRVIGDEDVLGTVTLAEGCLRHASPLSDVSGHSGAAQFSAARARDQTLPGLQSAESQSQASLVAPCSPPQRRSRHGAPLRLSSPRWHPQAPAWRSLVVSLLPSGWRRKFASETGAKCTISRCFQASSPRERVKAKIGPTHRCARLIAKWFQLVT
jgi:hypothetical protein